MKVTGGCHCGELKYEADIDPSRVGICHCIDCQILSGAAFRTAIHVNVEDFHLTCGTPRTYTKTGGSGRPRIMVFCGTCGTQIYGIGTDEHARRISLRAGTCDQRAQLKPVRQIWRRSAVDWLDDLGVSDIYQEGVPTTDGT